MAEEKARKKRRDPLLDMVRVRYWFSKIMGELGLTSARGVQRLLEPKLGIYSSEPINNSRYLDYEKGKHVPGAKVIAQSEWWVPGAARLINHPVWSVLRAQSVWTMDESVSCLRQLNDELRKVIFTREGKLLTHGGRQFLDSIERRAGLDALAALVVIMRLNYAARRFDLVQEQAFSLLRILLILGMEFIDHKVAGGIFELFALRVFPIALAGRQERFCLDDYPFELLSAQLDGLALVIWKAATGGRRPSINSIKVRILHGERYPWFVEYYKPKVEPVASS